MIHYRSWLIALSLVCPLAAVSQPLEDPAEPAAETVSFAVNATNAGTSFVVGSGYLLTAHHVIQGRNSIQVGPLADGKWATAEVVQSDAKLDLALLKANIDLPPVALYNSPDIPVGLEINVIGYPQPKYQGMTKKITQGIVNGYRSEKQNAEGVLMQISAEISRGNSGGPVFASDGTVIGLVERKMNAIKVAEQTEDWVVNVNYALRSSQIIKFLESSPVIPQVQKLSLDKVLRPYELFSQKQASVLAVMGRTVGSPMSDPN